MLELKGSLFQTLKTLVEHVLHGLSGEEVCEVLKVRVTQGAASQPLVGELLQMDETIEAMGHDEKHEMQEVMNLKRQLAAAHVFENEYRQLHAKVIGLARGKASANPKNAKSPLLGFRTLAHVPANAITQPEAKQMCPPGAYIWKGLRDGNWCIHLPPYPRYSKAWQMLGHYNACICVLQHGWRIWLRDNHLAERGCPVKGLFCNRPEEALAAASSSSSAGAKPARGSTAAASSSK